MLLGYSDIKTKKSAYFEELIWFQYLTRIQTRYPCFLFTYVFSMIIR